MYPVGVLFGFGIELAKVLRSDLHLKPRFRHRIFNCPSGRICSGAQEVGWLCYPFWRNCHPSGEEKFQQTTVNINAFRSSFSRRE